MAERPHEQRGESPTALPGRNRKESVGTIGALQKFLLSGLLATSFDAMPAAAAPPSADEIKHQQMQKDLTIAALRTKVEKLVEDLDDDQYPVRDKAHKYLDTMAKEWVQRMHQPFPGLDLLVGNKSLEQSHRLSKIRSAHEHTYESVVALPTLWLPTRIAVPEEWKKLPKGPRASEVLHVLEEQMKTRVHFHYHEDFKGSDYIVPDAPVPTASTGGTFWELLCAVQRATGKHTSIRHGQDQSFYLTRWPTTAYEIACVDGIAATLSTSRGAYMCLFADAEPKLLLGNVVVTEAVATSEKGERIRLHPDASKEPQTTIYIAPSQIGRRGKFHLSFTVELTGYRPKSVVVNPNGGPTKIPTAIGDMEYLGLVGTRESRADGRVVWQVRCSHPGRQNVLHHMAMIRCKAFDAKHKAIAWHAWRVGCSPTFQCEWEFFEEPARLEFVTPERETRKTVTFVFPEVSL